MLYRIASFSLYCIVAFVSGTHVCLCVMLKACQTQDDSVGSHAPYRKMIMVFMGVENPCREDSIQLACTNEKRDTGTRVQWRRQVNHVGR